MRNKIIKRNIKNYSVALLAIIDIIPGALIYLTRFDLEQSYGIWAIVLPIITIATLIGLSFLYKFIKKQFPGNEWSRMVILTCIIIPPIIGFWAVIGFIQR